MEYKVFIDMDDVPTGVTTGRSTTSTHTQLANERGHSTFIVH